VPALRPVFESGHFILHNAKFDYKFLAHRGLVMKTMWDTMLAEQVIYGLGSEDARKQGVGMGLADLVRRHCNAEMSKEARSWFIDLDKRPDEWNAPFPTEILDYAAKDLAYLETIMTKQQERLDIAKTRKVFDLEMRCLPALAQMELAGIRIDTDGWRRFVAEKSAEALDLEDKLLMLVGPTILEQRWQTYDEDLAKWQAYQDEKAAYLDFLKKTYAAGEPWGEYKQKHMTHWRADHPTVPHPKTPTELVNVNSQTAMLSALQALGVDTTTTDSKLLEEKRGEYPVVDALLDYRKAVKFVQSFGDSLLEKVGDDGRIHPEYVQIGASTGRMSCKDPNWQQVPSKGDGEKLRTLVVAAEGYQLITADFNNIELRILADLSRDPTMLRLFAEGKDLHAETARMMFNLPADMPVKTMKDKTKGPVPGWGYRDVAKTINFMLAYGGGQIKLSRTLRKDRAYAKGLIQKHFAIYGSAKTWLDKTAEQGFATRRSVTVAGRKRFYKVPAEPSPLRFGATPEQMAENRAAWEEYKDQKARIERQSKNTPIQGSSADITKLALALWYELGINPERARLVACVHDELVVEAEGFAAEDIKEHLCWCMETAAKTYLHNVNVPPTEANVGESWTH
jgi:DNA polymerase I